ncbi:MAG: hypothetical protein NZ841_06095 [Dictyoglomus sp.]|nr:hypothetical protein [Dictyoglomus sp.]MCX7941500.1 hypothetical protein [Dictyoglomaceae bacterium]MDW8188849.1 ferritin family protein [Dictyoglomus sp.]
MPEFGTSYSVLSLGRKVTQLYEEIAESTDNELAKKVLYDIANEEKIHAGKFLRLL